jgi:alpha-tubulin suppressor-like RCC1 family protein
MSGGLSLGWVDTGRRRRSALVVAGALLVAPVALLEAPDVAGAASAGAVSPGIAVRSAAPVTASGPSRSAVHLEDGGRDADSRRPRSGRVVLSTTSPSQATLLALPRGLESGVTDVGVGIAHAAALQRGRVHAWGFDGVRSTVPADARSGVSKISVGSYTNLALKKGRVIAWGDYSPALDVPAALSSGVTAISAGHFHNLALKGGRVYAWGFNSAGETKVPKAARSGVTAIAAGEFFSVALKKDGRVLVWGATEDWNVEVPRAARSGVSAISAGRFHVLAVKKGRVIAWGGRADLADNVAAMTVPATATKGVRAIVAGDRMSFAVKNGSLLQWGGTVPLDLPRGRVLRADSSNAVLVAVVSG